MTVTVPTANTRRPLRRRLGGWLVAAVAIAVVTLALVAKPPPVRLAATYPADGAVLDLPPIEVSLLFNGTLRAREFHLTVAPANGGAAVSTSAARLDGQAMIVPVSISGAGRYLAGYHVLLADGAELSGVSWFEVTGAPAPASGPGLAAGGDGAVATGHAHRGDDPLNLGLLALDLVLILAAVVALLRRPRLRSSRRGA